MAVEAPPKNQKPLDEIPFEAIDDLAKQFDNIMIKVNRRDARGVLNSIYSRVPLRTVELATIDGWLNDRAGGGKFEVFVQNPNNPTHILMRFNVPVEGAPRMPARLDVPEGTPLHNTPPMAPPWLQNALGPDGLNAPPSPPGHPEPSAYPQPGGAYSASPYPAPQYGPHARQQAPAYREERPAPGARYSSDQVALQRLAERDAEVARLNRTIEEQARAAANEQKRIQGELDRIKDESRDRAHKAEMEALRAEMRALANGGGKADKGIDLTGIAAIVAAVAPILNGRQDAQTAGLQMQQTAMQQTMQLALAQAQKPSELSMIFEKYGPLLAPMLKEMMGAARGNDREMQLVAQFAEQQMANLMGVAQIVQEMAPADESPVAKIAEQGIQGVMAIGQAWLAQRQEEQQRAQAINAQVHAVHDQRMTGGVAPAGAFAGAPQQQVQPQPQPQPQQQVAQPPRPATPHINPAVEGVLAMLPPDFQTDEWRMIIVELHREPPPPALEIGRVIVHYIEHLALFNKLPPALDKALQDPRGTIGSLLGFFPVARTNPAYVGAVVDVVIGLLQQSMPPIAQPTTIVTPAPNGAHEDDDDGDDDEDDGDEIQVYPSS